MAPRGGGRTRRSRRLSIRSRNTGSPRLIRSSRTSFRWGWEREAGILVERLRPMRRLLGALPPDPRGLPLFTNTMVGVQEEGTGVARSPRLSRRLLLPPCYWPKAANLPRTTASGAPGSHQVSTAPCRAAQDAGASAGQARSCESLLSTEVRRDRMRQNFCRIFDFCITYGHREASSYEKEIGWEILSHCYLSECCFPAKVFKGTQHK